MSSSHGDLSDALRNMADGEHDPEPAEHRPEDTEDTVDEHDATAVDQADADPAPEEAMLEDEAGDFIASAPAAQSTTNAARRTTPRRSRKGDDQFKAAAVPVLFTVGGLLILIGIWALLLLLDVAVPMHQRSGSQQMAIAMLVCWPVGLALIAGGVIFHKQIQQARKQD